jgi:hypothetical protein
MDENLMMNHGKAGGLSTSWVEEPSFQSVPCLPSHNKLIGSENPCQDGGLVGGSSCFCHAWIGEEGKGRVISALPFLFSQVSNNNLRLQF